MRHPEPHLFAMSRDALRQWCESLGWPAYRAEQILEWVYKKRTIEPSEMSNLPSSARALLAKRMHFRSCRVLRNQHATDGTRKLLVQWEDADGATGSDVAEVSANVDRVLPLIALLDDPTRQTECVMIPTESRRTACISSQVGCPVGCRFCASGLGGLDGNLSAGRIVEQVWLLNAMEGVERITNVVFMGMGEPLANIVPVMEAVRILTAPWGLNISARRITISTVGLPRAIERLARDLDVPVTLALSLHAPNDDLRRSLIPWSNYTTIEDLLDACRVWFDKTGREITLEYILIGGVNDRPDHAEELASVARTLRSNVNLIRYNEVGGLPFVRPRDEDVLRFRQKLADRGVNVHIRSSRGRDIAAACGQLRHEAGAQGG